MRALLVACLLSLAACSSDPVREQRIEQLGPEVTGVPPGPLHRPNQPCLLCHDGDGPGDAVFSVAGTVFKLQQGFEPLPDALVRLVDSQRRHFQTAANCAGNFFVDPHDFDPEYPLWVSIEFGSIVIPMSTPIFREGSCASCHGDPASTESAGHVYFAPVEIPFPPSSCP